MAAELTFSQQLQIRKIQLLLDKASPEQLREIALDGFKTIMLKDTLIFELYTKAYFPELLEEQQ